MQTKAPNHIAFIMDGNRRWAKKHVLSLFTAHNTGAENIEQIVEYAKDLRIGYVTFWAFSTENWNRPEREVATLFEVFRKQLKGRLVKTLKEKKARIKVIGDLDPFPQDIKNDVADLIRDTAHNDSIVVTIALNYGGRADIIAGIQKLIDDGVKNISQDQFSTLLYTSETPDPDLIIRTGGEMRLSGFLPWQSVYSELYFTETLWPDFGIKDFKLALSEYTSRQRRFGS